MRSSGQETSPKAKAILDQAEVWQQKFQKTEECFWTESEEYEWGGGEDYLISPYDIDLRESEHWVQPIRDRDRPFTTFSVWINQIFLDRAQVMTAWASTVIGISELNDHNQLWIQLVNSVRSAATFVQFTLTVQ